LVGPNFYKDVLQCVFVQQMVSVHYLLRPSLLCILQFCCIRGFIQKFPDWVITKHTLTAINTRWEATQMVMAAKLTRLTYKTSIQLHLMAESCLYYLQFSLQAASPETFGYNLVSGKTFILCRLFCCERGSIYGIWRVQ
jgi:hypothetical protein